MGYGSSVGWISLLLHTRADRPGASASVARCRRPGRRSVGTRGIRPPTAPYFETTPLPLVTHLGDGEKEVLALGLELSGALLLLDDRDARRHALALELEIVGTLGVLLLAKERGILDAVRPVLDRLQALRFRLDARTRLIVLELASET